MPGQRLAAVMDRVRPRVEALLFADTYAITRMVTSKDPYGGEIQTPEVVETGNCLLTVAGTQGQERASGETIVSEAPYLCTLPVTTTLTATDTIEINGTRTFRVIAVRRPGEIGLHPVAQLEETA